MIPDGSPLTHVTLHPHTVIREIRSRPYHPGCSRGSQRTTPGSSTASTSRTGKRPGSYLDFAWATGFWESPGVEAQCPLRAS